MPVVSASIPTAITQSSLPPDWADALWLQPMPGIPGDGNQIIAGPPAQMSTYNLLFTAIVRSDGKILGAVYRPLVSNDLPQTLLGFYGATPIARAVLATGAGHTVDDVITALQNLGLVKQM